VVTVFAFFTPAITPPFAARSSDTAPTMEAGSENRASVAPPPSRRCHDFRFPPGIECAHARGALSPAPVKRAANGRVTDSGFKKKR